MDFHPGCSGMCCFTWAAAQSQQLLFWGFGSWSLVFNCGLPRQISPLPPTPSQTAVCSTMGESIRPSSFHNPTLSANKHVMQIYRSSLSAAVQTSQVSVESRLSTGLKDRAVVPKSYRLSLCPSPLPRLQQRCLCTSRTMGESISTIRSNTLRE